MTATILIVEDNPLNLRLVRDILEYRGFAIETATNVQEASERIRAVRPDLVLLDIQIPGGGGERVLGEIRDNPSLARLPVIALTALAMEGDRERLLNAGFDGYLSKPIDTRTFGSVIESYLEKGDSSDVR